MYTTFIRQNSPSSFSPIGTLLEKRTRYKTFEAAFAVIHGEAMQEDHRRELAAQELLGEAIARDVYGDTDDFDARAEAYFAALDAAEELAHESREQALRARATLEGRYAVTAYYRKTMRPDASCRKVMLNFADYADAVAWNEFVREGNSGGWLVSYNTAILH